MFDFEQTSQFASQSKHSKSCRVSIIPCFKLSIVKGALFDAFVHSEDAYARDHSLLCRAFHRGGNPRPGRRPAAQRQDRLRHWRLGETNTHRYQVKVGDDVGIRRGNLTVVDQDGVKLDRVEGNLPVGFRARKVLMLPQRKHFQEQIAKVLDGGEANKNYAVKKVGYRVIWTFKSVPIKKLLFGI